MQVSTHEEVTAFAADWPYFPLGVCGGEEERSS